VGTLELCGRRVHLRFPVSVRIRSDEVTAHGAFFLDRNAVGLGSAGLPWDPIRPEVVVTFFVRAQRNER